jgi:hypothetical protein
VRLLYRLDDEQSRDGFEHLQGVVLPCHQGAVSNLEPDSAW